MHSQAWVPKTDNDATNECNRDTFAKYPNDEEASVQIETNMDDWDKV